jgi:hypothetical protein
MKTNDLIIIGASRLREKIALRFRPNLFLPDKITTPLRTTYYV